MHEIRLSQQRRDRANTFLDSKTTSDKPFAGQGTSRRADASVRNWRQPERDTLSTSIFFRRNTPLLGIDEHTAVRPWGNR